MPDPTPFPTAKRLAVAIPALLLAIVRPAWTNDPEGWEKESILAAGARTCSVSGRVVDARTGAFLAGAAVGLFRHPGRGREFVRRGRRLGAISGWSREDGSFEFGGLPAGVYTVTAESPGHLKSSTQGGPRAVTVRPGGRRRSLVIRLQPEATIQGSVLDGAGRAAEGARVRAFTDSGGALREVASGGTDGSGEFIVRQLPPGRYFLLAELPATRALAYFPASPTASGAAPIQVLRGEHVRGIRIQSRGDPAHWVRGRVDDFRGVLGDRGATVHLVPRSDSGTDLAGLARTAPLLADRSFEFGGIPAGLYRLQLVRNQPDRRIVASREVAVGSADVEGLGLHPGPPVSLRGRVRVAEHGNWDLTAVRVAFLGLPTAAGFATAAGAPVGPGGRFLAEGLEPASYALQVQAPPDLYVRLVRFGGRPIAGAVLDLATGGRGSLDIELRDGAARIEGAVLETGSPPDRAARTRVAILHPTGARPGDRCRRVVAAAGSRFAFSGVPPGTYRVFVTDLFDPDLFAEPAFLARIPGAMRSVSVRRHDRKQLDLRLITARQVQAAAQHAGFAGI